jgi:hypothetical protein
MLHSAKVHIAVPIAAVVVIGGISAWYLGTRPNDALRQARRIVKTATDPEAKGISLTVQDTTIEDLVANKAPESLGRRVGPFEKTIWRVHGTIETIEKKKDGDYYLTLRGANGGRTVVEVPDPDLCKGSPVENQITKTRYEIEEAYHPGSEKQEVNKEATIEGVGFYGFGGPPKRGSTGFAGPRLLPGTAVHISK